MVGKAGDRVRHIPTDRIGTVVPFGTYVAVTATFVRFGEDVKEVIDGELQLLPEDSVESEVVGPR